MLGFEHPMQLHNISIMQQLGCPRVTIFSNGSLKPKDDATAKALEIAKAKGAVVDERPIQKLVPVEEGKEDSGIDILFTDGSTTRVGFLAHKPPTGLNAPDIARGLGLEILSDGSDGWMLKRNEPFGESDVPGVFVAGDSATPMRQATVAMMHGLMAGGGVNFQLVAEEDERIAESVKGGDGVERQSAVVVSS